ncbi:GH36-type glycosyl hydrolase domain-containing protein [Anaerocolumna xylanovorans]|uniref:Glycosyltransferase family 36 n=1 Tax=Anaerocolumna xylanovorans DSM 12503 TaxID=1121345 RepID=A0A1M7YDU6_9FIRM|nr:cellobiose phosphorylase [Anaerocolumna xylanovorans]SHO50805.1 Glycosyltransferase family 36 [Anaerocolumna xylanovorans DSM 12503]
MKGYQYLDENGTFCLENPELTGYLYFPIANEKGVMASVTPSLGGDNKMGQNTFLLAPVSSEDLHDKKGTRNFWVKIEDKGLWSATGASAWQEAGLFTKEKDKSLLKAGMMWHSVKRTSEEFGIEAEITSFVPLDNTVEIMTVTLRALSDDLTITPTAAIPLYGRSADNIRDHRHVTSLLHRMETVKEGILLNPTLTFDERGHRKNEVVYGVAGAAVGEGAEYRLPAGFYPVIEDFIGEGGSLINPRALLEGAEPVKAGFHKDGYETLGGIAYETCTLKKGEEKTYIIVLGYGKNKEDFLAQTRPYLSKTYCDTALEEVKKSWLEKLNIKYHTSSADFDAWMQWVDFQPILRRIYGCSFLPHHDYGKGGRGWRDLWQDCLALLIMNPDGVRDMLWSNYAGVRADGSNATIIGTKQGEFIADRNNITRVWMDHGVWPFLTTRLYIMQTGDTGLLFQENTYFKDPQAVRGEEKDLLWKAEDGNILRTKDNEEYRGTVLEHVLIELLTAFYDVGEHNHMRLRGADWNDALDMAKERGESVAFSALFGQNLVQLGEMLLHLKEEGMDKVSLLEELFLLLKDNDKLYEDVKSKTELLHDYCDKVRHTVSGEKKEISLTELSDNLIKKGNWIKEHIRKTEWISDRAGYSWYNSYYDNNGRRVEGDNKEGVRMMLTGQVFTIMSGIALEEQVKKITAAADNYLYAKELGGYRLNTDFHELKTDLGRMFGFAYGSKENGAVFAHMAVMYANALYQRNFIKEGYEVINSLYSHLSDFEKSRIYPGIPEYIGDNGRGLYHYLTGSASWLLLTVLTEMFGVKGEYGSLLLEPKLLKEQFDGEGKTRVSFVFGGKNFELTYVNREGKEVTGYRIGNTLLNDEPVITDSGKFVISKEIIDKLDDNLVHKISVELV